MSGTQKCTRIRSGIVIAGWPLFHVASGPDLSSGEIRGHARGIFAVGDIATVVVAIGGIARGIVAVGGIALGLFSLGGCSFGLALAFGGVACGVIAYGGVAIGIVAVGGVAVGIVAGRHRHWSLRVGRRGSGNSRGERCQPGSRRRGVLSEVAAVPEMGVSADRCRFGKVWWSSWWRTPRRELKAGRSALSPACRTGQS